MSGNDMDHRTTAHSPWRSLATLAVFVVGALTILPTTLLVLVGVVPMVVTLVIDDSPGRYLARTVAGMATAALIPFIASLWSAGHTMRASLAMVTDVYTWFAIYAAVGMGWLMFLGFPSLVAQVRAANGQRRVARLKKQQQELIAEWGEAIAEPPGGDHALAAASRRPATASEPAPSAPG